MIPKFRLWNRITSQLHLVDGLYFDDKEAEYVDDDNVLRFIGFKTSNSCNQQDSEIRMIRKSLREI